MASKLRNQKEIKKCVTRIASFSRLFLIISILVIGIGFISVFKISNINSKLLISGHAVQDEYSSEESYKLFLGILYITLLISLLLNIFFFLYFRKALDTLSDSEKRVENEVDSLKERKNDEIEEVIRTRNVLLDKLSNRK